MRYIRNLFEHQNKDYHKPVRVGNFWSINYFEYKSKGDKKYYQLKNILIKLNHT